MYHTLRNTLIALFALGGAASFGFGSYAIAPARQVVGRPPADLAAAESITIPSGSGARLAGWFIAGAPHRGAVLLMHGVRGNRLQIIERIRYFSRVGFTVLAFDFQASGESTGQMITFGWREAQDARAAFGWLHQRAPGERIGVVGMSLGGAAAILAEPTLEADAFVLEAVYTTFSTTVGNRIAARLGSLGRDLLTPLLTLQLQLRLGVSAAALAPVERIGRLKGAILLIGGAEDRYATGADQRALLAHANEPKELWMIPGAGHVDFQRLARDQYEAKVGHFLTERLAQ